MNRDASHFDMTEAEEAKLNERNARKLYRSDMAWREVCMLAQVTSKDGFYERVDPLKILDVFNRMHTDHLKIDGKW